ncbi:MAG: diguanylate cyclase, partial [Mangrovicoccus sp.]|nr:diguanylate cyclase [Mangrovicoccus sp.]
MVSIRVRTVLIAAFLVASGMPLLTFWAWPHSAALQKEMNEANDRHLLLALTAAGDLKDYHANVVKSVQTIAPLLAEGQPTDFAVPLLSQLRFRHFCLIDPLSGEVLRVVPVEPVQIPAVLPPAMLATVLELADRPAGGMAPVRIAPDGEPEILMAQRRGERVVLASLGTGYVRDLSARIVFGLKGHAVVVDQTGRVIAHPRADWVAEAHDLGALAPVQQVLAGVAGVRMFFSPAIGAEVIAGMAPVPGVGWGVMVPQPISELHAAAARIAQSARFVFLTGLGLSALIALVFSTLMSKGIQAVSAAARQMTQGDDKVRIRPLFRSLSLTEIEELRTSFNTMAQEVGESRQTLLTMVTHDSLTGLLNRRAFLAAGTDLIDRVAGTGNLIVTFFIDVDHFKSINDIYGHAAGDELLVAVAQRLQALAGPDDLIARQSGDEFLLLHLLRPPENAETFGRALADALSEDHDWNGRRLTMTCSVGGCVGSGIGLVIEQLIRCADQAMYIAKER